MEKIYTVAFLFMYSLSLTHFTILMLCERNSEMRYKLSIHGEELYSLYLLFKSFIVVKTPGVCLFLAVVDIVIDVYATNRTFFQESLIH